MGILKFHMVLAKQGYMMTKKFATTAIFILVFFSGSAHAADCYHKPGDMTKTIREADDGAAIVWSHGKKKVTFETGSGGTGVDYRIALDKKGKGFRYEYQGLSI